MKIDREWCEKILDHVAPKGPLVTDYVSVCYAFNWIRHNVDDYRGFIDEHVIRPHREFVESLEYVETYSMLLHIWDQPRGYSGDGDLLQKMYNCFELPDGHPYVKTCWDNFICGKPELLGLQHRKTMFREQLDQMIDAGAKSFVDLGCGNGWYTEYAWERFVNTGVPFGEVIGMDQELPPPSSSVHPLWVSGNVLKKLPNYQCDIVYSGGLFDYFTDGVFSKMLVRIQEFEPKFIMIGNIDQSSYTKSMMECFGWYLFDRSRWDLLQLTIPYTSWTWKVETDITKRQHFLMGVRNEIMFS